ncbi:MAG: hypothetical protein RMJ67_01050 [Elusimicrobiota bacterium]|nr:hypothetical protein [Endomicrobiia bacterium]MDW8165090.1 hypothetical protein [Elusimicrobiota bacterium]
MKNIISSKLLQVYSGEKRKHETLYLPEAIGIEKNLGLISLLDYKIYFKHENIKKKSQRI